MSITEAVAVALVGGFYLLLLLGLAAIAAAGRVERRTPGPYETVDGGAER